MVRGRKGGKAKKVANYKTIALHLPIDIYEDMVMLMEQARFESRSEYLRHLIREEILNHNRKAHAQLGVV